MSTDGSTIDELLTLVGETAVKAGFDWHPPGHAFTGDEPGRPTFWRVYSEFGWLGGPHVYAEVDASTRRILLIEERGWETPGSPPTP